MAKEFSDVLKSYEEKQQKEWELAQKLEETGEGKEVVDGWFKLIVSKEEYGIIVDALEELFMNADISDEDSNRIKEVLSDISSRKTLPNRKELLLSTGLDIPGQNLED
jgi:cytochrome c551/c552